MMINKAMFILATAILASSCWVSPGPGPWAPIGEVKVVNGDGGVRVINETDLCGVNVVWEYLSQTVTFTNKNDHDVRVEYTDYNRFPGPWGKRLSDRESFSSRQMTYRGKKVHLRARDFASGGKNCDQTANVLLAR
jgi:hypothetical protein